MAVAALFGVSLASGAVALGALAPLSPVSIDVTRERARAGETTTVVLGRARLTLRPPVDTEVRITRHRDWPWSSNTVGETYEFEAAAAAVSAKHPADLTLPLPTALPPGSTTVVAFQDSEGWTTHLSKVGPDGLTATARVDHLSVWTSLDLGALASSLSHKVAKALNLRTDRPACDQADGVVDAKGPSTPLAWVCVERGRGASRRVRIQSNTGFPFVAHAAGPVSFRADGSGGLVEQIAATMYARNHLVLVPAGGRVDLDWDGSRDATLTVQSESLTVFITTVLTLATALPARAAKAVGALASAVECLARSKQPAAQAWQACAGAIIGAGDALELRHKGLRITGKVLSKLLSAASLAATIDLLIERGIRKRSPIMLHLRVPARPKVAPPRRGELLTAASISVHGCH